VYEEYADLPENAHVRSYTLGEIASEKVLAVTDPARNEPRDLYDLWYLTGEGHIDLADLIHAIEEKWAFREKRPADVGKAFEAKEARWKKLWLSRLSSQMAQLPRFDEVYRTVRRAFRAAGLLEK
jgi:predicted nucleotidyltransferase component of viral defense system